MHSIEVTSNAESLLRIAHNVEIIEREYLVANTGADGEFDNAAAIHVRNYLLQANKWQLTSRKTEYVPRKPAANTKKHTILTQNEKKNSARSYRVDQFWSVPGCRAATNRPWYRPIDREHISIRDTPNEMKYKKHAVRFIQMGSQLNLILVSDDGGWWLALCRSPILNSKIVIVARANCKMGVLAACRLPNDIEINVRLYRNTAATDDGSRPFSPFNVFHFSENKNVISI